MHELITFKGTNKGLQVIFDKSLNFAQLQEALKNKLASCTNFFTPDTVISLEDFSFSAEEKSILTDIFQDYKLKLKFIPKQDLNKKLTLPDKIVNRTVRGGEEVTYKGSIIINGNVNPGAKIIAGGNIDIHGSCRGVVHAGAFGDVNTFIIADNLSPLQIRIAGFIARCPDDNPANSLKGTEKAMIKNGNIILEPFTR